MSEQTPTTPAPEPDPQIHPDSSPSSEAAAAASAHYILVRLHPERKAAIDAALERSLGRVPDPTQREAGRIMGMSLGMILYAILSGDGR